MTQTRRLITIAGADAIDFLQGLTTNDLRPLTKGDGIVWTALLTPQGKYLADFFVVAQGGAYLIDLPEPLADATLRRLAIYRLRADVQMTPSPLHLSRGVDAPPPPGALPDPRHPAMGWRLYAGQAVPEVAVDWDALRVEHLIPEAGIEMIPDDSYILELGFERLHGVDFRKGCYVGQEVTARMKHKTDLKKGLARVRIDTAVPAGTEITADGKPAGKVYTQSSGRALAWLRFDRAGGPMQAGDASLVME